MNNTLLDKIGLDHRPVYIYILYTGKYTKKK